MYCLLKVAGREHFVIIENHKGKLILYRISTKHMPNQAVQRQIGPHIARKLLAAGYKEITYWIYQIRRKE